MLPVGARKLPLLRAVFHPKEKRNYTCRCTQNLLLVNNSTSVDVLSIGYRRIPHGLFMPQTITLALRVEQENTYYLIL